MALGKFGVAEIADLKAKLIQPKSGALTQAKAENTRNYDWVNTLGTSTKAPAASSGDPWWMTGLQGLSAPGKMITNTLANWTDGKLNWNDIPFWESIKHAGQNQWANWHDGSFDPTKDLNVIKNAFVDIGKNGKGFDQTLENWNWKQAEADPTKGWNPLVARKGQFDVHDIASFIGDVVLDPLTYATLGTGSVLKSGASAAAKAAKGVAEQAGIKAGSKAASTVPMQIFDQTVNKFKGTNVNQDLAERLAIKKTQDAQTIIKNAGASARNAAQNAAVSLDVPFTKFTKQFGSKPDLLKIADGKIGHNGAGAVSDLLEKAGVPLAEHSNLLNKVFGKTNAADLTLQELKHLQDQTKSFKNPFLANDGTAKNFLHDYNVEDVLKGYGQKVDYQHFNVNDLLSKLDPRIAKMTEPLLHDLNKSSVTPEILGSAHVAPANVADIRAIGPDMVKNLLDHILGNSGRVRGNAADAVTKGLGDVSAKLGDAGHTASIADDLSNPIYGRVANQVAAQPKSVDALMRDISAFAQDAGGRSALGKKLPQVFNPRSFGSVDPLVNQGANSFRDAETQGIGQAAQLGHTLQGFSKDMADMTAEEKRLMIYLVEGKTPENLTLPSIRATQRPIVVETANKIKNYLHDIAQQDFKAGTINEIKTGYFPHVVNPDPEVLSRVSKFAGSASNKFGKQRTSFESFAQLDDAIAKLDHGYQGAMQAGDTAAAEEIAQKIDDLQNLFQSDPLTALAERGYKSIKTRAMSELHTKLQADGLLKIHTPENSAGKLRPDPNEFHTLSASDIATLGVKVPDKGAAYMHKEVYEGLQKMDTILKDKGAQKLLDQMNEVVGIWKNLVTTSVPSHFVNNAIGNIANNAMAGVGIKSYVEAGSLLKKAKNFERLSPDQKQTMQELFDKGVLGGQGQNSEFIKSGINYKGDGKLAKVSEFAQNNAWSKFLRKNLGENVDAYTRTALYLHGKELTGSADKAAEMVRKYLFNYHELTNADKHVRAFVPFWNWTKHNLPLQIQHLATQPRFAQTYLRFKDALQGDNGQGTPDWVHEAYLKVPGTDKTYFNPRLPISDLNQLGGPVKDLQSVLGMLNPILKVPIEIGANHQFFSDKPIDYKKQKTGSYDPAAIGQYLASQTGIAGKVAGIAQNPTDPVSYLNLILGKPVTLK